MLRKSDTDQPHWPLSAARSRRRSRLRPFPAALLLAALAAVPPLLSGCGEEIDERLALDGNAGDRVALERPLVERDLPQMEAGGVLRMITRYNSSSYFIDRGGHAGFEYELLARFAGENGLALEVVVPEPDEDPLTLLNSGRGDVLALGSPPGPQVADHTASTHPYNFSRQVLLRPAGEPADGEGAAALAGLTVYVPHRSSQRELLRRLREQGGTPFFAVTANPLVESEELIARVSRGDIEATVAEENLAMAAASYLDGVRIVAGLTPPRPVSWQVRSNSPELLAALNGFLAEQLRMTPDGPRRSRFYGILYARYYEGDRPPREPRGPADPLALSDWDDLMRAAADSVGLDWRLVAAVCYQESRFNPDAVSPAGAVGLMQVLPRLAGVDSASLHDPEINLRIGARMLADLNHIYDYLAPADRLAFTVATYHAGFGHMTDARRLAMDAGRDPNRWRRSLDQFLPRLMEQRWFSQTRHGFYRGAETVTYVQAILNRYRMYRRLLPARQESLAAFGLPTGPSRSAAAPAMAGD